MEKEQMVILTANRDTALTIHKQIVIRENYLLTLDLFDHRRKGIEKEIKNLRRKLNRINYEASL